MKIGIQGELGAYSHIAANKLYKDAEIKTCASFEETFKQAHQNENYKIIIPIENSLAGRVADIHYLLPKYKLQIHGEYFLNVEHNLLSKPEATINDIEYVYPLDCSVQIRHQHKPVKCIISNHLKGFMVEFVKPIRAIAPGQSAVFYDEDICLGGGVISETF